MIVYNTLTREKQPLQPIETGKLGIYLCGVTTYDYCHIGHARTYLSFDVIIRYLRYCGYQVTVVRNITDIDDKIIKRAQANHEEFTQLTERFIQAMHEDFAQLGISPPEHEPRATEYMPQMISMIESLIAKGFAYAADNGDVYYNVKKFDNYGQLSGRKLDDLKVGARVEVDEAKQDPLDFVLWKHAKPGEPSWDSPWGQGRPGWHLECSAMSNDILGETFDIHGGGFDLIFPHHENECAQSEACSGQQFVKHWMHAGFLQINKEKMSKSLGNFSTIRDVLKTIDAESFRLFMISSHYRSPLEYSSDQLLESHSSLERLYTALRNCESVEAAADTNYQQRFEEAMNDDFNTPIALAVLFDLARDINRHKATHPQKAAELAALLKQLGGVLGLLQRNPMDFLQGQSDQAEQIEQLIIQRNQARKNKDWAAADAVRDQLQAMGVELEDTAEGTTWRKI